MEWDRKKIICIAVVLIALAAAGVWLYRRRAVTMDFSAAGSSAAAGAASASAAASGPPPMKPVGFYPLMGTGGLQPRVHIADFLDQVRYKISQGMAPGAAWFATRKEMYVLNNKADQLQTAMLGDSALNCFDGSGNPLEGDQRLVDIMNTKVPQVLATAPCAGSPSGIETSLSTIPQ
jgi:hypothetical protein